MSFRTVFFPYKSRIIISASQVKLRTLQSAIAGRVTDSSTSVLADRHVSHTVYNVETSSRTHCAGANW